MLKKRIIPILLLKQGRMVKGKLFSQYRDTGDPVSQARIYNSHNVDELVFLDIEATAKNSEFDHHLIEKVAKECFIPLTVGGGIKTLEQIRKLLQSGADKVVITSAATNNYDFIQQASKKFGKQCIVCGVDVRQENGSYKVYSASGHVCESVNLDVHVRQLEAHGAGEILLTSIDHDGTKQGYDIALLTEMAAQVRIPVIISGGAGNFDHLYAAFQAGAHAVAIGSLYHFGDNNPTRAAAYLASRGVPVKSLKKTKLV